MQMKKACRVIMEVHIVTVGAKKVSLVSGGPAQPEPKSPSSDLRVVAMFQFLTVSPILVSTTTLRLTSSELPLPHHLLLPFSVSVRNSIASISDNSQERRPHCRI